MEYIYEYGLFLAQAVTFVTGHAAAQEGVMGQPNLDWVSLARPNQTGTPVSWRNPRATRIRVLSGRGR